MKGKEKREPILSPRVCQCRHSNQDVAELGGGGGWGGVIEEKEQHGEMLEIQ